MEKRCVKEHRKKVIVGRKNGVKKSILDKKVPSFLQIVKSKKHSNSLTVHHGFAFVFDCH